MWLILADFYTFISF